LHDNDSTTTSAHKTLFQLIAQVTPVLKYHTAAMASPQETSRTATEHSQSAGTQKVRASKRSHPSSDPEPDNAPKRSAWDHKQRTATEHSFAGGPILNGHTRWQIIPRKLFHFNYVDNPDILAYLKHHQRLGYAMQVQLRGHRTCACLRSRNFLVWLPHDPATGDWPAHFDVSKVYMNAFFQANPNLEMTPRCGTSPSYGWYGHETFWPWALLPRSAV